MNSKKTILIFDDDINILELCTIILTNAGYHIETSSVSDNVIQKVTKHKPDLVLMDNWIPNIGGVNATQLLKNNELFKHIPVIFFSSNDNLQTLAKQAGADSFLSKPFDLIDLENIISETFAKQ